MEEIPPDFLKHIQKEESVMAVLKCPSGSRWDVKLSKRENGTFIQDGWQNFLRDHSLGNYEVLVFRYNGDMCFDVQIFDKTGSEKLNGIYIETHQEPGMTRKENEESKPQKTLVEPSCKSDGQPRELVKISGKRQYRPPPKCVGSTRNYQPRACKIVRELVGSYFSCIHTINYNYRQPFPQPVQ
ncbi:hypothetical protein AQUCO_00400295v1 [Aquilegia coerulea]|uniref:TF-B3 domain-containing protein n=1 Tax=Aquilegia coerulea TaxID=218851 RepID=A0A2G5EUH5_AQUCA|nr:hypothetical protein AQUCO_00400295v1 [Aquilegia coerulea]